MKRILTVFMLLFTAVFLNACRAKDYLPVEVLTIQDVKDAKRIDITFLVPFGQDIQEAIEEMIEDFNEEYPNIRVRLQTAGGYDELLKSMRIKVVGKNPPTMAIAYPDHVAEYLMGDAVLPLDPYINSKHKGVGYTEEEFADFFEDYMFENRSFDDEGTYYSLPFNKSTEVLIYNKDFFDKFELEPPKTWAEAETLSAEIWRIIESGEADDLYDIKLSEHIKENAFSPFAWDSNANFFITATRQWGGTYTKKIDNTSGELLFNDTPAIEAMEYALGLSENRIDGKARPLFHIPEFWGEKYSSDPFKNLQAMFTVGSTAGIRHNVGAGSKVREIGVAPVVYKDENHKYVIQQGSNVMISKRGNHLERMAAWLLVKHFLEPENTAYFSMQTAYFPVRKSALEDEQYQQFLNNPTIQQVIHADSARTGIAYREEGFTMFVDPAWSGSAKVREQVGLAVATIFTGDKSISVKDKIAEAYRASTAR